MGKHSVSTWRRSATPSAIEQVPAGFWKNLATVVAVSYTALVLLNWLQN